MYLVTSRTDSVSGGPSPSLSWESSQEKMAPTEYIPSGQKEEAGASMVSILPSRKPVRDCISG